MFSAISRCRAAAKRTDASMIGVLPSLSRRSMNIQVPQVKRRAMAKQSHIREAAEEHAQGLRVSRRSCRLDRLALFTPFLDLHAQRADADAQRAGRLQAVPAELLQGRENDLLLDVRQRLAGQAFNGAEARVVA